jgi:hypothetical protein
MQIKCFWGKWRDDLLHLGTDGKNILRFVKEWIWRCRLHSIGSRWNPLVGSKGHENKHSDCINGCAKKWLAVLMFCSQTLPSQYLFSLLVFVAKNRHLFLSNSDIHDKNMRQNCNLHLPITNLTLVQKGVPYSRSRIYNHFPTHIKTLSNDLEHFKSKLKSFFIRHTFYILKEFYQLTFKWLWFPSVISPINLVWVLLPIRNHQLFDLIPS